MTIQQADSVNQPKINFAHQFLAKLIPAINNAENPTQSMDLTGKKFFHPDQYIHATGVGPMPQDGLSL